MFRYDFQHPDPDSSISPSKEDLPLLHGAEDAHMADAPSNSVPSHDTLSPSRSLVLRPCWPSPTQVACGAVDKEESFTPVPSQYRSPNTCFPPRAAYSIPRPDNQQVNASKASTIESSTLNTMGASCSTYHPANRRVDAFSAPSTDLSTPDMVDMAPRMEALLEPVSSWLERLQGTTLPPYNPRVQTKSAAKVLSDRLLPVGRHVLNLLKKEWEGGVSEVDIW